MSRKKQNKKKDSMFQTILQNNQIKGIVIMLLSILAILDSGLIGNIINIFVDFLFGNYRMAIYLYFLIFGFLIFINRLKWFYTDKKGIFVNLVFFNVLLMVGKDILLDNNATMLEYFQNLFNPKITNDVGLIGYLIVNTLIVLFGEFGIKTIIVALWILTTLLLVDLEDIIEIIRQKFETWNTKEPNTEKTSKVKIPKKAKAKVDVKPKISKNTEEPEFNVQQQVTEQTVTNEPIVTQFADRDYTIPSAELLEEYGENNQKIIKDLEQIAADKAKALIATLASFNLRVEISNILIGPNVTKYELQPELGVKISKFSSLSNDIALALAAKAVRIEAPIPGKQAIGIEIPNDKTMMVGLKEVLKSKTNDYDRKLQVGLGKDISGESRFIEINKTPHMLVAGATGSGKSVCINGIIISLLTKTSPQDVKMIMIDPKKVELTPFNGIPHLLTPVVTEPKKAAIILKKMVAEMEHRYELFSQTNTRNIEGFNKKIESENIYNFKKLPYIVIIVDELADLMMVASNDVEESIARLAQMARAAGIHLIIATQRPSTDVITGLIKANIPTRIAFAVSSSIDSRTILDTTGAEKLLGKGDMLVSEQGSNTLTRIQGAFISDEEVMKIVDEITEQFSDVNAEDNYDEELTSVTEKSDEELELDEYYEDVKHDFIQMQKASASHIQRRYKVGFNRAMRIIEQLEANGVISESEGTKPRKVLIEELDENQ